MDLGILDPTGKHVTPDPDDLRQMVRSAFETLLDSSDRSGGRIPVMPVPDLRPADAQTPKDADPEHLRPDVQLDLSRDSDWELRVDRILEKPASRR